ncbi:lysophospholipid acyltransferase family protein [Mycoplasma phocoenae]|uniref:1-acyl-sn-glycerol-3-phosphate acyltransferase n=1 Tax=Mycoplasma phocoenae TaxID=754517 RepID=A0A858U6U2_9MOLU|nr:lysophospholipid acyltransferase family protein [Mycoplasma phocoenae]QJG66985.1 1-acyl-sn-glycerol-3-phosphate acyltransferase [Mycoplasma phocoenae]
MNLKTKMILLSPYLGLKLLGIMRRSKQYQKSPAMFSAQDRHDWLLARAKKFLKIMKINVVVKGYENLPKNTAILYPNHVSDLDPVIMMAALAKQTKDKNVNNKMTTFLAKQELQDHKTTRRILDLIDTFFINRKSLRKTLITMDSLGTFAKENKSYAVIFPEGTRSKTSELLDFKPGAFKIAKSKFYKIVPVTINNSGLAADPKRCNSIDVEVIFHKPINDLSVQRSNTIEIAQYVQRTVESQYLKQDVYVSEKVKKENPNKLSYAEKQERKEAKKQAKLEKKGL